MEDKNYIFDELKSQGKSIRGEESKLFRELLDFEKKEKNKLLPLINNIIDFYPVESGHLQNIHIPMKLAAQSDSGTRLNKADFLISKDGKFVIKFSRKTDEEIHITLIAENDFNVEDAILFSPELNKYFVSNLSNEYIIGQYSSFDLSALNFKAILPFEKIMLSSLNNSHSIISLTNYSTPVIEEITNSFILLNPNARKEFFNAVIISDKSKDFLEIKNGLIEIPLILVSQKMHILLY